MSNGKAAVDAIERAAEEAAAVAAGAPPEPRQGEGDAGDSDGSVSGASAVTGEEPDRMDDSELLGGDAFPIAEDEDQDEPIGDVIDPPLGGKGGGGGAGSSGDAWGVEPPLPPPLAAPPQQEERRAGREPMAVLFVPGGKLTYYYGGRDINLVAECRNCCHGRCVRTKTLKPPAERLAVKKKGQGRPLGLLTAWLARGVDLALKSDHWSDDAMNPSKAERQAARERVKADASMDARMILAAEADKGSGSEPEVVP